MTLGQGVPDPLQVVTPLSDHDSRHRFRAPVRAKSLLGGLHHEYSFAPTAV